MTTATRKRKTGSTSGSRKRPRPGRATASSGSSHASVAEHDVFEEQLSDGETGKHFNNRRYDDVGDLEYDAGEIAPEDDEEIDEDEAFDESDEEKWGSFFSGKLKKRRSTGIKSKGKGKIAHSEDEEDFSNEYDDEDDDDEDDDDGDCINLSEMLDEKPPPLIKKSTSSKTPSALQKTVDFLLPDDEDSLEEVDDELIAAPSSSEESQDEEDEIRADKLGDIIASLPISSSEAKDTKKSKRMLLTETYDEDEFSLPNRKKGVDMTDLVGALSETTSFGTLKKQLETLDEKEVAAVPLPAPTQARLDRAAAYEQSKKAVDQWSNIVAKNRQAETLVFLPSDKGKIENSAAGLVGRFKPSTDLENEVNTIVSAVQSGERNLEEVEGLETNQLDVEEVKARRAELAKIRSLLFFREQKLKKIAKIKSKTYRKVLKKERIKQMEKEQLELEELAKLDPEFAKEQQLKLETERARERMTLRHKNTGKWARSMLGRNEQDEGTRRAISEQLEKHEKLRRRIAGINGSDSELSDDESGLNAKERAIQKLEEMEEELEDAGPGKSGIFGMKFMRDKFEREKHDVKKALGEARNAIEADDYLENNDDNDSLEAETDSDSEVEAVPVELDEYGNVKQKVVSSTDQTNPKFKVFEEEEFVIEDETAAVVDLNTKVLPLSSQNGAEQSSSDESGSEEELQESESEANQSSEKRVDKDFVNPWLAGLDSASTVQKSTKTSQDKTHAAKSMGKLKKERLRAMKTDDNDTTLLQLDEVKVLEKAGADEPTPSEDKNKRTGKNKVSSKKTLPTPSPTSDSESDSDEPVPTMIHVKNMNTRDVLSMAFANDDVVEEFEQEKQAIVEKDMDIEEEVELPGWGSWAGSGVKKTKPKAVKAKAPKVRGVDPTKRRDKSLAHVIINEKRNKKVTQYMLSDIPHPFENREQYERSIRAPVGKEWNTMDSFQKNIMPRIKTVAGSVINPLYFVKQNSGKSKNNKSRL